jgi:hypothetical protein
LVTQPCKQSLSSIWQKVIFGLIAAIALSLSLLPGNTVEIDLEIYDWNDNEFAPEVVVGYGFPIVANLDTASKLAINFSFWLACLGIFYALCRVWGGNFRPNLRIRTLLLVVGAFAFILARIFSVQANCDSSKKLISPLGPSSVFNRPAFPFSLTERSTLFADCLQCPIYAECPMESLETVCKIESIESIWVYSGDPDYDDESRLQFLGQSKHLIALKLSNISIQPSDEETVNFVFPSCKSLRSLDISNTNFVGVGLSDCPMLESVDLSETDIGDEELLGIQFPTCLKKIDLRETECSSEGILRFSKRYPACRVVFEADKSATK